MFLTGVIISTIELFLRDRKKGTLLLIAIFLVQFLYYTIPFIIPFAGNLSGDTLTGIIPSLVLNEYGFDFIAGVSDDHGSFYTEYYLMGSLL